MAKRHKHYKKNGGGANIKKSKHGKIKHRRPTARDNSQGNKDWYDSGVPVGAGDLDDVSNDYYNRGRAVISAATVEDYYFKRDNDKQSMRVGGLRPGYNRDVTPDIEGRSGFRKRPMVFVKSMEVYDPAHDLILKLAEKNRRESVTTTVELTEKVHIPFIAEKETEEAEELTSDELNASSTNEKEDINLIEKEKEINVSSDESLFNLNDEDLFFIDNEGATESTIPTVHVEENTKSTKRQVGTVLEFNPSLIIGKTELHLGEDVENGSVHLKQTERKYHPFHGYVQNIMKNIQPEVEDEDFPDDFEDEISDFEDDIDDDIDFEYEEEESHEEEKLHPRPSKEESPKLSSQIEDLHLTETKNSSELNEPEFGFMEDDYVISTDDLMVSNIRLGYSSDSYYVKCYKLFGDYNFRWIEQEVFTDFILEELCLPEHRLNAYLKYIKDSLIPKEEPVEPRYSDVPFSDTSSEGEGYNRSPFDYQDSDIDIDVFNDGTAMEITSDMDEGLEDLISFTLKHNVDRHQEYETKSLEFKGKGKNKKLLVSDQISLELETINTLQSKLEKRLSNKAKRRRAKEDFIDEENRKSKDLFKKYPYGLHVQNIRDELDSFLNDTNRSSLFFPPLDPHGNKTVSKFAKHYYMKSSKVGKANHTHIQIEKVRKTKWKTPNYDLISQLLKQRPVFMRIDVQRPREEFVRTERLRVKSKFATKEGELVGKDAPEIGQENIGRKLLEKLGWSIGEGLGPHGNKGISEPLMARVKKNKSGLRHKHEATTRE